MPTITLPKLGEHIIFCGTTGSGKTVLAQEMLQRYEKLILFDTQDSLNVPGCKKITDPNNLLSAMLFFKRIRFVPSLEYRNKTAFNAIFKKLMTSKTTKGRVIYIDEIYHLGYAQSFPDWLSRGISTARQKKISIWISSQRPTNIPMPLLTEARRIYLFYLSYADDLKKVAKFTRDEKSFLEAIKELKYDYSFIELDRISGTWQKMPKLKLDEGGF